MSQTVYPSLPGIAFGVERAPVWSSDVQTTPSGREYRGAFMTYPRYRYKLVYEFLRDTSVYPELATLLGFFNARQGQFDTFLFSDPTDNSVAGQQLGSGDGTTTSFQLTRTYGAFTEPVYDLNGSPTIYRLDWQGNQKLYSSSRTNWIVQSEGWNLTPWSLVNATVTTGVASLDGRTGAATLVEDTTATAGHYIAQSVSFVSGLAYCVSVYCKLGAGSRYAELVLPSAAFGGNIIANLDLNVGTVAVSGAGGTAGATNMGGGWWRFWVAGTANASASGGIQFRLSNALTAYGPSYTGDGSSSITFFAPMVEAGTSTPTAYFKTTSASASITDYAVSSTGLVTLAQAPAVGAALTWTGGYYWRCRFTSDTLTADQFMNKLWSAKTVDFITVKP
jgi:hypothetical protein